MSAAPAVLPDRLAVTPSRLLVINGNTTADLTASLAGQARAFFGDAARVHAVTVPFGPAYIASRAQAAVSAHAVCETAEREAALAEAAILTALQRGDRYAIVTVGRLWPGMLREQIRQLGLESRCAGLLALPGNALDYVTRSPATIAAVGQALDDAVALGADVVIVAGAALAGFLPSLPRLPAVPVIDSYRAALSQVQALATLERAQRQAAGR